MEERISMLDMQEGERNFEDIGLGSLILLVAGAFFMAIPYFIMDLFSVGDERRFTDV